MKKKEEVNKVVPEEKTEPIKPIRAIIEFVLINGDRVTRVEDFYVDNIKELESMIGTQSGHAFESGLMHDGKIYPGRKIDFIEWKVI